MCLFWSCWIFTKPKLANQLIAATNQTKIVQSILLDTLDVGRTWHAARGRDAREARGARNCKVPADTKVESKPHVIAMIIRLGETTYI